MPLVIKPSEIPNRGVNYESENFIVWPEDITFRGS